MATLDIFAAMPLWTTWKIEARGGGNPTKVPYAIDGRRAKSNDPSSWMTRTEAEKTRAANGHEGLNIMVGQAAAPDRFLAGVDIDHCLDDDGFVAPWANDILTLLDSYTEVSYSGTGLRIFFLYDPALIAKYKHWRKHVQKPHPLGGKDTGIEVYFADHFLAVTGGVFQDRDELNYVEEEKLVALQAVMRRFDEPNEDHPVTVDEVRRLHDAVAAMDNNDLSWEEWNTRGMAIFRATGGGNGGYGAFLHWCQKSSKFVERNCRERWDNWRRSPPRHVTEGTVFYWARQAGWIDDQADARRKQYREARRTKPNGHATEQPPPAGDDEQAPTPFNLADSYVRQWVDKAVPTLSFVVADLLPHRVCSLIGGDSGSGKSILIQTICTCIAAGIDCIGQKVPVPGVAIYITAEDPEDMLHARQDRIVRALNITMNDVQNTLIVKSMADHDMWMFGEFGPSALAASLIAEIEAIRKTNAVRFLAIDSAALVFEEEEIRRKPVASFMKYLNRIARKLDIGVALIAHTSRSSNATTKGMVSGSTAWVAQSRAGLLLETNDRDESVKLSLIKPNYSKRGIEVMLKWNGEGVLMLDAERQTGVDITHPQMHIIFDEIAKRWMQGYPKAFSAGKNTERSLHKYVIKKLKVAKEAADRIVGDWLDNDHLETAKIPGSHGKEGIRIVSRPSPKPDDVEPDE